MRIFRLRSSLPEKELLEGLDSLDGVAVRSDAVGSLEELKLADHLAKDAFSKKENIARKMRYEFLLWLSGKTDIKSAMRGTKPDGKEFLVVVFSDAKEDAVCRLLEAKELPLKLKKDGDPLRLERISLSRIKG